MRIWIDNTGLQSAALCLQGTGSPDHDLDVRGLLQLATLIIFGNRISLNGFENKQIARRSQDAVALIQSILGKDGPLLIKTMTEEEYGLACKTAADTVAPDLIHAFNPNEHALIGGGPPEAPRGLKERQIECIRLASGPVSADRLREIEETALDDKAIGAVEYMIASSPALREAIRATIGRHRDWSDTQSYQLNIFLRYHLNSVLGEHEHANYAPAIARAELIARRNNFLVQAIGQTTDEVVAQLRGEPLCVPSTVAALLERSKGEPRAVLEVAREFRARSGVLRNSLQSMCDRFQDDTPETRFEVRKMTNELGHQLRRDIGLEASTKFGDAIELRLVVGVPVVSVSGKTLLRWVVERQQSRRVAVLTELVRVSAYSEAAPSFLRRLQQVSSHER